MPAPGSLHLPPGSSIEFETPENVRIHYPLAGPGTRFLAWLLDWLLTVVLTVLVAISLIIAAGVSGALESQLRDLSPDQIDENGPQFALYFVGIMVVMLTFGSFCYYFLSEFLMRGQTIGKRVLGLRVVKANGFALDSLSLLLRNIFRFVDHLPPLWVIPVLSSRTQRTGDMVAGTLVVRERSLPYSFVREQLAERSPLDSRYRFDSAMLARLRPIDLHFIEELLDRWDQLPARQLRRLIGRSLTPLCQRLAVELPPTTEVELFLEELLIAEYHRRERRAL